MTSAQSEPRTFAVLATYVTDAVNRRAPHRAAHLEYARALVDRGVLLMAGAFADPVDGALLIYRATSREEVERIVADDPYVKAGLWPSVTIREWTVVIGAGAKANPG
jgi:uncharacterized protein YciI